MSTGRKTKTRHVIPPKRLTHPVIAPGIEHSRDEHRGDYYLGTAGALLDAGLALPEWLPGQPECPNSTGFSVHMVDRTVEFLRYASGLYRAVYRPTDEQRAIQRANSQKEVQQYVREAKLQDFTAAQREESAKLARLPADAGKYRADVVGMASTMLNGLRRELTSCDSGFRVDSGTLETFDDAAAEILAALRASNVRLDSTARARAIVRIKHKSVAADPQFSTMLQSIVAGAKEADHG